MKKILLPVAIVIVLLIIPFIIASTPDYTIDGDSVYIDDNKAYIKVTPHTLEGTGYIEIELKSKTYTGDVNVILGYNGDNVQPTTFERYNPHTEVTNYEFTCENEFNYTQNPNYFWCYYSNGTVINEGYFHTGNIPSKTAYWNVTQQVDWTTVAGEYGTKSFNYDGKDTWRYVTGIPITANTTYNARIRMKVPPIRLGEEQDWDGKYDLAFYPSSYGTDVQDAIQNGHLYLIDPWTSGVQGIVGYYSFDNGTLIGGNSTLFDLNETCDLTLNMTSGEYRNATPGILNEGLNFTAAGQYRSPLNVSDCLASDTGGLYAVDDSFAISWWLNTPHKLNDAGAGTQQNHFTVDANYIAGWLDGSGFGWLINCDTGTIALTPTDYNINTWHHWVIMYNVDNDTISTYLDGVATDEDVGNCNGLVNPPSGTIGFVWGAQFSPAFGNRPYVGDWDESAFFNRYLTHEEIRLLYNNGTGLGHPFVTTDYGTMTSNVTAIDYATFAGVNVTYDFAFWLDSATENATFNIYFDTDLGNQTNWTWSWPNGTYTFNTSDNLTIPISMASDYSVYNGTWVGNLVLNRTQDSNAALTIPYNITIYEAIGWATYGGTDNATWTPSGVTTNSIASNVFAIKNTGNYTMRNCSMSFYEGGPIDTYIAFDNASVFYNLTVNQTVSITAEINTPAAGTYCTGDCEFFFNCTNSSFDGLPLRNLTIRILEFPVTSSTSGGGGGGGAPPIPPAETDEGVCGNGLCEAEAGETRFSCPQDCVVTQLISKDPYITGLLGIGLIAVGYIYWFREENKRKLKHKRRAKQLV